jgi:hypothetical protein
MQERDKCLHLIRKVREVAVGKEVAYVARSRIGRLIMAVTKLVGRITNSDVPDRPQRIVVPSTASPDVRNLVNLCNCLNDTARVLVQPSEPLDERWTTGWAELLCELSQLEQYLQALGDRPLTIESR